MLEVVFTLDYEINGNGTGTLQELVHEPARRLLAVFRKWNARFVAFVEAAELEKIEACGADPAIDLVKKQIGELYRDGCEVGLHLHPQWCNARYERGTWVLEYSEYNLCALPRERVAKIVDGSLAYLRGAVERPDFVPLSFRAGNWLFQPTGTAAGVLAERGIQIDSSVFKGGHLHAHGVDYRPALRNGCCWRFEHEVTHPDPEGHCIEVPIYTEMVPFWRMATSKRLGANNHRGAAGRGTAQRWNRVRDILRLRYPLKLDFCRMTLSELTGMMERVIRKDREQPDAVRPIVAIGHTKDLRDYDTVESFLSFLRTNQIRVSTFTDVFPRLTV